MSAVLRRSDVENSLRRPGVSITQERVSIRTVLKKEGSEAHTPPAYAPGALSHNLEVAGGEEDPQAGAFSIYQESH